MPRPTTLGFTVIAPRALLEWRPIFIDGSVPMDIRETCPACGIAQAGIAVLVSGDENIKIRVGACPACGYVGFMDFPDRNWLNDFYSSGAWDEKQIRKDFFKTGGHPFPNDGFNMAFRLPLKKDVSIVDIGCGYGETLFLLKERGFNKLFGVEHSPHRAASAREALGVPIYNGQFESEQVQKEFRGRKIDLFLCHHVLEHVFNPDEFIAAASALQNEGNYFVLSVPNREQETSASVLFFLPHLHTFTMHSLRTLFARHGYEIIDESFSTKRVLNVVAQKKPYLVLRQPPVGDERQKLVEKIVKGFGLGRSYQTEPRLLWWYKKADVGGQTLFFQNHFFERLYEIFFSLLTRYLFRPRVVKAVGTFRGQKGVQSLVVKNLKDRVTSEYDYPIEVRFTGPVMLLCK